MKLQAAFGNLLIWVPASFRGSFVIALGAFSKKAKITGRVFKEAHLNTFLNILATTENKNKTILNKVLI
jgi:hypothetical protein